MLDSLDCRAARPSIDDYLSGELADAARRRLATHLGACRPCGAAFDEAARLRQLLRRAARREPVPASLRERIRLSTEPHEKT